MENQVKIDFGEFSITIELLPNNTWKIVSWENILNENNEAINCNDEECMKLIKTFPNIYRKLSSHAARFRRDLQ